MKFGEKYYSVPLDLDHLDLVLLFLALVLGDDDEVGVGALKDVLDGVVEDPLHVDPPQRSNEFTLGWSSQQGRQVPDLDNSSSRS